MRMKWLFVIDGLLSCEEFNTLEFEKKKTARLRVMFFVALFCIARDGSSVQLAFVPYLHNYCIFDHADLVRKEKQNIWKKVQLFGVQEQNLQR